MKNRRSRRLGKLLGIPVLAICGFAIAATLASVGIAETTTTDTSTNSTNSTTVSTNTTTTTTTTTPDGGEGCTPGFWKQDQHFDSWVGYARSASFETVFGVTVPGSPTLLDALNAGGGGVNALMRHAVAALLNASNPDVDSDFTVAEVIALVQAALAPGGDIEGTKNLLAAANEQGCPLS